MSTSEGDSDLVEKYQELFSNAHRNGAADIEDILSEGTLNINFRDEQGNTALHFAVKESHKETIDILLKYRADVTVQNNEGNTPFDLIEDQLKTNPTDEHIIIKESLDTRRPGPSVGLRRSSNEDEWTKKQIIPSETGENLMSNSNPLNTHQNIGNTYETSKSNIHGFRFQLNLIILFALRARKMANQFRLATEMDAAEKLDDVVMEHTVGNEKRWKFVQAKHKQDDDSKIRRTDLANITNAAQFGMSKYFLSFIKIKNNIIFKNDNQNDPFDDFAIVTNADFDLEGDRDLKDLIEEKHLDSDDMLYLDGYEVKKYQLCANNVEFKWFIKGNVVASALTSKYFEEYKYIDKFPGAKRELENRIKDIIGRAGIMGKNVDEKLNQLKDDEDMLNELVEKGNALRETIRNVADSSNTMKPIVTDLKRFVGAIDVTLNDLMKANRTKSKQNQTKEDEEKVKDFIKLCKNFLREVTRNVSDPSISKEKVVTDLKGFTDAVDKTLNDLLEERRGKSQKDQSDANALKYDEEKLSNLVMKCNALRKTIQSATHPANSMPNVDADLREFIDLTNIKSAKTLDKRLDMTVSALSIIKAALDDATFDEYFIDFVQKFQFIFNFPNEKKLGDFNKGELGKTFKLSNADFVYASLEKEMLEFMNCNMGENEFHTEEGAAAFVERIMGKINGFSISGMSMGYHGDLRVHNIFLDQNSSDFSALAESLDAFLDPKQQNYQIFYIQTQSTRLSAIKTLQIIENIKTYQNKDSFIFIPSKKLAQYEMKKLVFNVFKEHGSHNLLVINFEDENWENGQIEHTLKDLLSEKRPGKKIVLIAKNLNLSAIGSECQETDDSTSFRDLDEASQKNLLAKEAKFQGKTMHLSQLIDIDCGARFFDEEILTRLLNENKLEIGNENAFQSTGYVEEYYIERTFGCQIINPEVLKYRGQLFFITLARGTDLDISECHMKGCLLYVGVPEESIFYAQNDDEIPLALNEGIIIPPLNRSDQEYYEMFRKLRKNVHWLELHPRIGLFLKTSTGDMSLMIKNMYMNPEHFEIWKEHDFCNMDQFVNKVVLIANEAGMGKSTVLTSVARKMKEWNEKNEGEAKWIVRIDLNDHVEHLRNFNFGENDIEMAIDFVARMAIPGDETKSIDIKLQRTLFKLIENEATLKKPKIVLIFDGFDEISPNYESNTTNLIKALMKSDVAQIWVTTRAHEQDHLQKEFAAVAYMLNPLTVKKQTEFLDKFWKWKLTQMDENSPKYREILNSLRVQSEPMGSNINATKENLKRDSIINELNLCHKIDCVLREWNLVVYDENSRFTTVPLLLRIIADVTLETNFVLPEKNHLISLYENFMKIKFDIFDLEKAKSPLYNVHAEQKSERAKRDFYRTYNALAAHTFFPEDESLPGLDELDELTDETQEGIDERKNLTGTGLLISKGNELEFIHRSFAEYFFVQYLTKNLKSENVQILLWSKIVVEDSYGLVCKFLNDQFEYNFKDRKHNKKQIKWTDAAIKSISTAIDHSGSPLFVHIVTKGYHSIFKMFMKGIRHDNALHRSILMELFLQTDKDGQNCFHYALLRENSSMIDTILDFLEEYPEIRKELLFRRFKRGEELLFTFLTQKFNQKYRYIIEKLTKDIDDDAFFEDFAIITAFGSNTHDVPGYINNMLKFTSNSLPKLEEKWNEIQKNFGAIQQKRAEMLTEIHGDNRHQNNSLIDMLNESSTDSFEVKQILMSIDDVGTILHEAIKHGRTDIAEKILEKVDNLPTYIASELFIKKAVDDSTVLQFAARYGNEVVTQRLIGKQPIVNIDFRSGRGWTPLQWAAFENNKKIAQILIDSGAQLNLKNIGGWTALHAAACHGHNEIIELLVASGANIDPKDINDETPLQLAHRLGNEASAKILIAGGADVNHRVKNEENLPTTSSIDNKSNANLIFESPPLQRAIVMGDIEHIQLLIRNGTNVNTKFNDGDTSLHVAAAKGNKDIAEFLINQGANIDSKCDLGCTPLHRAVLKGHTKIVELLINSGADIDSKCQYGATPLFKAIHNEDQEVTLLLIEKGADVNSKNQSETPLHAAAVNDVQEVAKLLIAKGADVNSRNRYGMTPLHASALKGHTEIAELLIKSKAEIDSKCVRGWTALHNAVIAGHIEMVDFLINNGANIDSKQREGLSPLLLAVNDCSRMNFESTGKTEEIPPSMAASLIQYKMVQLLIHKGADIDLKSSCGESALHIAAKSDLKEIVQLLIKNEANIESKDLEGSTPLFLAALHGRMEIVRLLIESGANIYDTNNYGHTALQAAIANNHGELAQYLCDEGDRCMAHCE